MTLDFKEAGDWIYMLGESRDDINSSEYLHKLGGVEFSPAPHFDLEEEFRLQQNVSMLIAEKRVRSAHDISEGGLFVTLCESAFPRDLGFDVRPEKTGTRKDAYWFGEAQSRVVVSVPGDDLHEFESFLQSKGQPYEKLGMVTAGLVRVNSENWGDIEYWKEKYDSAIEMHLNQYLPE